MCKYCRIELEAMERIMGAGPIEDSVLKATAVEGSPPPPQTSTLYFGSEVPHGVAPETEKAEVKPGSDRTPIENLMVAQHLFIEAQQKYIHNKELAELATAQEAYILAQNTFISTLLGKK
jgi:hypothetical protein